MSSSTRTVLVTGGLGFLGRQVARALLRQHAARASLGERLVVKLVDVRGGAAGVDEDAALASDVLEDALGAGADDADAAVEVLRGDISDAQFCERAVGHDTDSVFHLAAIMSGQGEADFDAAISVNLHGTLNLLEAVRGSGSSGAKFVFASTGAVFGSDAAAGNKRPSTTITDATKQLPESSYGMTKSCCELLVNDYTRRGFVVGRSARLPTVVVRPGSPNAATTSVFSSVVREPLAGVDCVSPLPLDLPHAVVSHRTAVDSILRLHDIDEGEFLRLAPLAGVDRAVNLHATTVTLSELHAEAERVAASTSSSSSSRAPFGAVHLEVDDALSTIVSSMPSNIESDTAAALGLPGQGHTARDLVRIYCEDFAPSMSVAATEGDSGVEGASEKDRRVVAFLGLGNMGKSMARNVVSSGKFDEVRVWNRTQDTAQSFAVNVEDVHSRSATTVTVCDSPREAAKGAGVSLMCLGTEQACEEVLLDPDHGILTAADREGTDSVIVDHSTVSPGLSERCHIAAAGAGSGVKFLDGPISGGPEGASDGTLSIMCGGEDEAFGAARSVLECMGEKGAYFFPVDSGWAA